MGFHAPVSIRTKSALVVRYIDILAEMANRQQTLVNISIATLDSALARKMEPRAPTPARRLDAINALASAGIPVRVFTSPVILGLTVVSNEFWSLPSAQEFDTLAM
ncbi:SPL family radical SAM protein [Paucibacter sp. KCTC 42545]|uniref:SPL family radical SAM protein n=1 Tax=Paucibacter sp. KCTC 42545 TaxID=1768242 RepID=UPI000733B841|nr:hypothetical protein AT984_12265 [Paucibacter sp. KCTC 42545]